MNRRSATLLALALLGAALAIAWFGTLPAALPSNSESAVRELPGPLEVREEEFVLVDRTRPTAANGDFAGAPDRTLQVRAWSPEPTGHGGVGAQAMPLVLYSHGFFGNNQEPRYLAEHLASHGYIVASVDFPLTSQRSPGGPKIADVANQPGDISFLLDTLLAWNHDPANRFHQRIDERRIAFVGLSLGGLTTELATWHPRWRDQRVRAAVSLAGPLQLFDRRFFGNARPPFLMIAGDIDAMVPYAENARPVLERVPNAWLLTIRGASHTGFADQAALLRWMDNPDSIGCFLIRDKVDASSKEPGLYDVLGTPEEGILHTMENRLCRMDPLPAAISPLAQQRTVMVAVHAFLESVFAHDRAARDAARRYLQETLPQEIAGVTVERSAPQ